jgi:predicted DNA-binding ribbon-helix-helix protein
MKPAIVKRSVMIGGRKTSVSLEDEFWEALHQIALRDRAPVWSIVQKVDCDRRNGNLSSAIRVFVLKQFRAGSKNQQSVAPAAMASA